MACCYLFITIVSIYKVDRIIIIIAQLHLHIFNLSVFLVELYNLEVAIDTEFAHNWFCSRCSWRFPLWVRGSNGTCIVVSSISLLSISGNSNSSPCNSVPSNSLVCTVSIGEYSLTGQCCYQEGFHSSCSAADNQHYVLQLC